MGRLFDPFLDPLNYPPNIFFKILKKFCITLKLLLALIKSGAIEFPPLVGELSNAHRVLRRAFRSIKSVRKNNVERLKQSLEKDDIEAHEIIIDIHRKDPSDKEVAKAFEMVDKEEGTPSTILQNLRKRKYEERFDKIISFEVLQKISNKMYRGENTKKFIDYIGKQFDKKYKDFEKSARKLLIVEDQTAEQKDDSQIKGTYTVDVKDLKNLLGKDDKTPSSK